jgi:hypothetical protein
MAKRRTNNILQKIRTTIMSMNNGFFEVVVDGPLQDTIDQSYHSAPMIIGSSK